MACVFLRLDFYDLRLDGGNDLFRGRTAKVSGSAFFFSCVYEAEGVCFLVHFEHISLIFFSIFILFFFLLRSTAAGTTRNEKKNI